LVAAVAVGPDVVQAGFLFHVSVDFIVGIVAARSIFEPDAVRHRVSPARR